MRRAGFVVAFLACLAPSLCLADGGLRIVVDPDAYAVYSAILPEVATIKHMQGTRYVIIYDTKALGMCLVPDEASRPLMRDAIDSYVEQNAAPWHLEAHFSLTLPYELWPAQVTREFKSTGTLLAEKLMRERSTLADSHPDSTKTVTFEERFPGARGVVWLSAVGFNKDKTVAVVSIQYACGPMCSGAGFHVLRRQGDVWVPLKWSGSECSVQS